MAERTKIWIANAMKKLMVKKKIEKIRVTEICKEAEIQRPTFYYHFKDKYDLLAWIFFHNAFETNIISIESVAKSMNQMREDFTFYKRTYEDTSKYSLWKYMVEYFVHRYSEEAKRILDTDTLDPQTMYSIRLYCHGGVGMTKEWLLSDSSIPAETVVEMMFISMPESLRKIFFHE
ncbi:TetR/AcrR family transcriptional regulator C-terminal domain-containing protein [Actinomyces sp. zg-332]|uniref:TetR/AcrR family transcriptional regulator C-terminal domain-containing protein n=1 Tax=Actinomyces sp. zg-332 TaxID=2708340 RepID=UPI00141EFFC4|nr:TetR/AcrR family transcriptional regulator C-terminal domain-containing protein [Actinomyces sp. zg-332]QPK94661.1 TetR/AcrR family transcriptional regulator C-terminal domain-containing protein [Actinomyces sp. zg-332]